MNNLLLAFKVGADFAFEYCMHPYLERFLSKIRDCPICHFQSQADCCLCEPCQAYLFRLLENQSSGRRDLEAWDHQWLLTWRGEDAFSSDLVRHLKGGGLPSSFQMLAKKFVSERRVGIPPETILVFPTKGLQDHGWAWAQSLSLVLGLPIKPLKLASRGKQALKSRNQREEVLFQEVSPQKSVVFVDDVVTTGATVKAAFKALGRPKYFAIWSIFYRPPL